MFTSDELKNDINDAIQCLLFRKFRTILSALGVAIGTMALVGMLSISEGARTEAQKRIQALGIDTIRLENTINTLLESNSREINLAVGLSDQDYHLLSANFESAVIGKFKRLEKQLVLSGSNNVTADVLLINRRWLRAEDIVIEHGREITEEDINQFKQVCLVGNTIAREQSLELFSLISWQGNSCQIIGVLAPKGAILSENTSLSEIDFDRSIVAPINQHVSELNQLTGFTIKLKTDDLEELQDASNKVADLLKRSHPVDDYLVVTPATLLEKAEQEQKMFALVMGTIAGLSLLVGGIGIMNVMLAHVAEQTREIGLRIALGAPQRRVVQLFMFYSITLSCIGTLFGVIAGMLLALGIQYYAQWPVSFSFLSLTVGPFFSLVAGVVFGLYPALKASQVLPNTALRQL